MAHRYTGKTAIVTGAGSGIGRATALAFARDGAAVFAVDRDVAGVDETVAQEHAPGQIRSMRADVTDCLIGDLYKDFDPLFAAAAKFAEIPGPIGHGGPLGRGLRLAARAGGAGAIRAAAGGR